MSVCLRVNETFLAFNWIMNISISRGFLILSTFSIDNCNVFLFQLVLHFISVLFFNENKTDISPGSPLQISKTHKDFFTRLPCSVLFSLKFFLIYLTGWQTWHWKWPWVNFHLSWNKNSSIWTIQPCFATLFRFSKHNFSGIFKQNLSQSITINWLKL